MTFLGGFTVKKFVLMCLCAAMILSLAACGGNAPAVTPTPSVSPSPSATPRPTPEVNDNIGDNGVMDNIGGAAGDIVDGAGQAVDDAAQGIGNAAQRMMR